MGEQAMCQWCHYHDQELKKTWDKTLKYESVQIVRTTKAMQHQKPAYGWEKHKRKDSSFRESAQCKQNQQTH
eukprot:10584976-Karenia_brevis.AAC.1